MDSNRCRKKWKDDRHSIRACYTIFNKEEWSGLFMKPFLQTGEAPYICAPLTGNTKEVILHQLETVIKDMPDIIEWRADFLIGLTDTSFVLEIITEIKAKTDIPLLFTIRAAHEGGEEIALTEAEKLQLLIAVCEHSMVEMIDYETSNEAKYVLKLKECSKNHHKKLILSYHNFKETPTSQELRKRAKQAQDFGADVVKFAVMPVSKEDVHQLLIATKEMDDLLEVPVITMSMGELGAISRVIGWTFGSIMTFGVGVESSAPGQVPIGMLRETIEKTKELVPGWEL